MKPRVVLAGGRVFGSYSFFRGCFSSCLFQIGVQFIKFGHGQLGCPFLELLFVQSAPTLRREKDAETGLDLLELP